MHVFMFRCFLFQDVMNVPAAGYLVLKGYAAVFTH